jgi:cobalt-zinc-cadmium efflux system protein
MACGSSILAALFNAVFLLVAVGAIAWEATLRLFHPEPVAGVTVMIVATIGIFINGFTAWLFASGRKGDLNIRGSYMRSKSNLARALSCAHERGQRCAVRSQRLRRSRLYRPRF